MPTYLREWRLWEVNGAGAERGEGGWEVRGAGMRGEMPWSVHPRRLEHIVGVEGAVAIDVAQHSLAAAIALAQPAGRAPGRWSTLSATKRAHPSATRHLVRVGVQDWGWGWGWG